MAEDTKTALVAVAVQESTLSLFLKALTEKYPNDQKESGLTMAWITEKTQWYVAVNRYPNGGGPVRVVCVYDDILEVAVRNCMIEWRRKIGLGSKSNLKKFEETVFEEGLDGGR